jgi:hypothetical protein
MKLLKIEATAHGCVGMAHNKHFKTYIFVKLFKQDENK